MPAMFLTASCMCLTTLACCQWCWIIGDQRCVAPPRRALRTPSYSGVTSNAGTSYAERIASIEASRGLRTALNRSSSMYSDVRAPKPRLIESQYTPESSLKRNLSSSNAGLSLRAPIDFMGSPRHRTSSSGVTATRTSSYQSLRGAEPGLQRSTSSTSSALGSSRHLPNANPDAVSGSRVAGRHETGGWTAGPSATSAAVHDVVVVDSFRVDCREVEAVLLEESSVVAAIVIGSADAMRSDALQAFVQFAPANAGAPPTRFHETVAVMHTILLKYLPSDISTSSQPRRK